MLTKLCLGYYKAYFEPQEIEFAFPSEDTLGLTVLVGENNSGKSTALVALKELVKNQPDFRTDLFDLHDNHCPIIRADFQVAEKHYSLFLDGKSLGSYQRKKYYEAEMDMQPDRFSTNFVKWIPSRRAWNDAFTYGAKGDPRSFEQNEIAASAAAVSNLGVELRELFRSEKKEEFNSFIRQILPNHHDWDIGAIEDNDFIFYSTVAGRKHRMSHLGEGFASIFRVAFTLFNSSPGDSILLDEPELSLHPQAQKLIHKKICALAKDRQIILATHSPYLFNWSDLTQGAKLYRVYQDATGKSRFRGISAEALSEIKKVAVAEPKNRRLYDVLSKEMFFSDTIVFLEGPEDVQIIQNFLEERNLEELPLFGYGAGGAEKIEKWLQLAAELNLIAVSVYDKDKADYADKIKKRFEKYPNITILTLKFDDIRDKYLRDGKCAETGSCNELKGDTDIIKFGYFDHRWSLKPELEADFMEFLAEIRNGLAVP